MKKPKKTTSKKKLKPGSKVKKAGSPKPKTKKAAVKKKVITKSGGGLARVLKPKTFGGAIQETTLERLQRLIGIWRQPVPPDATVGSLVPSLDLLAAAINQEWTLPPETAFRHNEIQANWTVRYLASVIDAKLAA